MLSLRPYQNKYRALISLQCLLGQCGCVGWDFLRDDNLRMDNDVWMKGKRWPVWFKWDTKVR